VGKLLLVPVAAIAALQLHGLGLLTGWTLAAGVTVAALFWRLVPHHGTARRSDGRRWLTTLWSYRSTALGHHWLNLAVQAPRLVLPVVTAVVLGPLETAAFYVASLLVTFISTVPWHLSTVLFAVGLGDTERLRREVRLTMGISTALAVVSAPAIWLASRFSLSLFHSSYTVAAAAMAVLGLTVFPSAVKGHFVAISRVEGHLGRAALLASAGALLEIGLAAAGGITHGLVGIAVAQLIAQAAQAVVFAPTVWRVLRGDGTASGRGQVGRQPAPA
jgi:Na+-driven multidrug efflux pump